MREFVVLSEETKNSLYGKVLDDVMRRTGEWPYQASISPVAELIGGTLHVKASAMAGPYPRVIMVEVKVPK